MAALGQDDVRALEQTRQRLIGLHTSLSALQQDLFTQQPLPSWSSLQSHSALVSSNLQAIAQQLSEHQTLLSSLIVHPLPQFPNQQGHILELMLRTKFEPDIVEWVEGGQDMAQMKPKDRALPDRERNELWEWAPGAANAEVRKQKWGADYTLAEKELGIEKVVTGLKRVLVEPSDEAGEDEEDEDEEFTDEEDDEDDKMDTEIRAKPSGQRLESGGSSRATAPQMPMATIHRFMMTGIMGG